MSVLTFSLFDPLRHPSNLIVRYRRVLSEKTRKRRVAVGSEGIEMRPKRALLVIRVHPLLQVMITDNGQGGERRCWKRSAAGS